MTAPKSSDVLRIIRRHYPQGAHSLRRFPTGLAHYVFDVVVKSGQHVVVRMADPQVHNGLAGAVYWHPRLQAVGTPLPELIAFDLHADYPYMLLERLPGEDLGQVYAQLTSRQKRDLARQIAAVQDRVAGLPRAGGYGWLQSYEPAKFTDSWWEVVRASIERSSEQIETTGNFDPRLAERVLQAAAAQRAYLDDRPPEPFLDDTTTKNVLVQAGALSGIVDTDYVCFGDRLFVLALTRLALLADGLDTEYIDYWSQAWGLREDQQSVIDVYTAVHCLGFMAEVGRSFNQETPAQRDPEREQRLGDILAEMLARA